jgi:phosphoenolpyruvate carboxykinase (GTP)
MYVVPYLMAPLGSPLEAHAAGVQLTDCRTVVLHMIRMARVGVEFVENLADPNSFVRGVHVTGDVKRLGAGHGRGPATLCHGCRLAPRDGAL